MNASMPRGTKYSSVTKITYFGWSYRKLQGANGRDFSRVSRNPQDDRGSQKELPLRGSLWLPDRVRGLAPSEPSVKLCRALTMGIIADTERKITEFILGKDHSFLLRTFTTIVFEVQGLET